MILCDTLTLMKDKAELNQTIAAANLELACKWDKQEEEEPQERHELAKCQQRVEEEKLKNEQLGMALQMLRNADVMTPPMVGSTWPRVRSTLESDCLPALSQGTALFCLVVD